MKIIVLGGDGFCGWPTSLKLSKNGHEVLIIDNLSRRKIDNELKVNSLTPIKSIVKRISTWNKINKKKIYFKNVNITKDYYKLKTIIKNFNPDTIIHFAEQRAAPYSMKSVKHMNYTLNNNLIGNNNVLHAIAESKKKIHLIHLGTMGVYGYDFSRYLIPEGYYKADLYTNDKKIIKTKILHPAHPGSIYHLTKAQDELLFQFYNKMYSVDITDLHQGIVWGTNTEETNLHENLINRYDYDGDYGTALNRFIMQSTIKYPLTIHGSGNQVRPFINIKNTTEAILIAAENYTPGKKVKIFNQLTETHRLITLAKKIQKITKCNIKKYKNPRIENENNTLVAKPIGLLNLGLKPVFLSDAKIIEEMHIVQKYKSRIIKNKIIAKSNWKIKKK
jgi:UDP-sulfoquinovose synthase